MARAVGSPSAQGHSNSFKTIAWQEVRFERGVIRLSEAEGDIHELPLLEFAHQPRVHLEQMCANAVQSRAPWVLRRPVS